jgi:hydroxypyruvate reductase
VISSFGVGYDALDIDKARARKIPVGYTPEVLNDCVADTAFALLMDVARGISASDRFVRRGDWLKGNFPLATRVSGKKLGIVGLGRIGRVIARRAAASTWRSATTTAARRGRRVPYEPTLTGLAELVRLPGDHRGRGRRHAPPGERRGAARWDRKASW